jgi:hypothetical protein
VNRVIVLGAGFSKHISLGRFRVAVEQDVPCRDARGILHSDHARPAGGIAGAHDFGEAVTIVRAACDDEFAVVQHFQKRVAREVRMVAGDCERVITASAGGDGPASLRKSPPTTPM